MTAAARKALEGEAAISCQHIYLHTKFISLPQEGQILLRADTSILREGVGYVA